MPDTCQVLFIQGGGPGVHDEWDDKLVASLGARLGPDYDIHYPHMPNEDDPSLTSWVPFIRKQVAALDDGAFLVGHSIGASILLDALAPPPVARRIGGIFLVSAPFVGEGGWPSEEPRPPGGPGAKLPKRVPVHLYYGLDDDTVPPSHLDLYALAIPHARIRRLPGRDHQLGNDLGEVAEDIRSHASPKTAI